ncbi:MAG: response regulator [Deltaproteobacteria bacterium]|nr:response regulator [Deltaproteobacteria bacterium]
MIDEVTILAVDDVDLNLEMLDVMLSDLGCSLLKACNGRQALDALALNPATDIILLDLEMPVMDGFEVLQVLKSSEEYREIPVIVVTADRNEVIRTLALGANDFLAKPYDPQELRLRVMNHVRSKKLNDLARDMNAVLEAEVVRKTAALRQALDLSREAEYEITLRLGKAAEFRDLETGMHTRRISELSLLLASLAALPAEECEELHHCAALHDVGKVGIPDRILLKPGKLEEMEFTIIKQHTVIGGKILSEADRFPCLRAGQIVALQHHEKWDGSGYPAGLKGAAIHIYARIVMIVDVFDALTSERPYKKVFSIDKALGIMREGRGTFFDPDLLDLFLANIEQFQQLKEELSDPQQGHDPATEALELVLLQR